MWIGSRDAGLGEGQIVLYWWSRLILWQDPVDMDVAGLPFTDLLVVPEAVTLPSFLNAAPKSFISSTMSCISVLLFIHPGESCKINDSQDCILSFFFSYSDSPWWHRYLSLYEILVFLLQITLLELRGMSRVDTFMLIWLFPPISISKEKRTIKWPKISKDLVNCFIM